MHVFDVLSMVRVLDLGDESLKSISKINILYLPNEDFGKRCKELLNGVSTRFGLLTIEKYLENAGFIFFSVFQNLRLGTVPKSSIGSIKN